jgi:hypothetical protein
MWHDVRSVTIVEIAGVVIFVLFKEKIYAYTVDTVQTIVFVCTYKVLTNVAAQDSSFVRI